MALTADENKLPELTQQAIEWLVRLRSDDMDDAETHAFADWLSADIHHAEAFADAEELFSHLTIAAQSPRISPVTMIGTGKLEMSPTDTRLAIKPSPRRPVPMFTKIWRAVPYVLAAAWLFAVTLVLPQQAHFFDRYLSDYYTGTGEVQEVTLADGSQLLLNTHTAVSVDYQAGLRQIILHYGQARFTVATDSQRPFEVKSGPMVARALGTVFEVYQPESGATRVTVQEHAVAARLEPGILAAGKDQPTAITVKEGEQLNYGGEARLNPPEAIDLAQTSAWQQRKISINDRPLGELIDELGRYRMGRVFLADANLKNLRVVGVFSLADPEAVLKKVCQVLALKETRLGPWWVVLHR